MTQLDRIEQLLTEIRDHLRPLVRDPWPSPPVMFGYQMGQAEPPDAGQVQLAGMFLRGELQDQSTRALPVLAYGLAEEIVRRDPSQRQA